MSKNIIKPYYSVPAAKKTPVQIYKGIYTSKDLYGRTPGGYDYKDNYYILEAWHTRDSLNDWSQKYESFYEVVIIHNYSYEKNGRIEGDYSVTNGLARRIWHLPDPGFGNEQRVKELWDIHDFKEFRRFLVENTFMKKDDEPIKELLERVLTHAFFHV